MHTTITDKDCDPLQDKLVISSGKTAHYIIL